MKEVKLFPALALLSVLAGLVPQPAVAADPFYTRLLERGVRDLELGLTDQAQQELRTACFGFLDEPALLAEGLMQLGRAQAQAGDRAELIKTIERLVEIEDRFTAYSGFDGALKAVFESSLRLALPETTLERIPMFAHLTPATEPAAQAVKPPTPKQRKKALERQLAVNPDDADTLLALGQLHHTSGKLKPASELLDRLLAAQPGHEQALCLRAAIAIDRKECEPMLAGFDNCPPLTVGNQGAAFILECLVSAQRSSEAAALLEALPIERRQAPVLVRAARTIEKSADSRKIPTDEPVETDLLESVGFTLKERMRRLREEITESRFREHLEDAMQRAIELADDFPGSTQAQHLAAEVAYLSSEWQLVVDYFTRGGRPSADQPEFLFYLAVAMYELGNVQGADSILREALPNLPRGSFVDGYVDKILIPPRS